jgi:hypothetical protein
MIHKHTLQTSASFDRINDALLGKTNDDLNELIEDLEYLLYKAREIKNNYLSYTYGCDY